MTISILMKQISVRHENKHTDETDLCRIMTVNIEMKYKYQATRIWA